MALGQQLKEAREKLSLTTSEVAAATRMKVQLVEDLEREDFSRISAPVYGKGFIKLFAEYVKLNPQPLIDEYVERFVAPKSTSRLGDVSENAASGRAEGQDEPIALGNEEPLDDYPFQKEEPLDSSGPDLFTYKKEQTTRPPEPEPEPSLKDRAIRVGSRQITKLRSQVEQARQQRAADAAAREAGIESEEPPQRSASPLLPIKAIALGAGIVVLILFVVSMMSRCQRPPEDEPEIVAPPVEQTVEVAREPQHPYID